MTLPLPPPLPRELLAHVRFVAASVKSSPWPAVALVAAQCGIARRCASDAERDRAWAELSREVTKGTP